MTTETVRLDALVRLQAGDYVLATKYHDGDPRDNFCVGRLQRIEIDPLSKPRYFVIGNDGQQFRANGFRRAKKIGLERGTWLVEHFAAIEQSDRSVWWWARRSMRTNVEVTGAARPHRAASVLGMIIG